MKRAKVNITIECPGDDGVTKKDFIEWIAYELGLIDDMDDGNELEYAEISHYFRGYTITTTK